MLHVISAPGFRQHFDEINSWFAAQFSGCSSWLCGFHCTHMPQFTHYFTEEHLDASSFVILQIKLLRTVLDIFCWVYALSSVVMYPRTKLLGHSFFVSLASRFYQHFSKVAEAIYIPTNDRDELYSLSILTSIWRCQSLGF